MFNDVALQMQDQDSPLIDQRDLFEGNFVEYSGQEVLVYSVGPHVGIDLWSCSDVKVSCLLCPDLENIDYLYIRSMNHVNIELMIDHVHDYRINTLVIESPVVSLNTQLRFQDVRLYMSGPGPKVSLPDYISDNIYIHREKNKADDDLREGLTGVTIIPGCGEFALDPELSRLRKAATSLDELIKVFPNTEWVSPVISWFGTSIDIQGCQIIPGIDRNFTHQKIDQWRVADIQHDEAYAVSLDSLGRSNYGGTISDDSVLKYLTLLKDKALKICFYPLIQLDVEGKAWRGRLSGDPEYVEDFYQSQYRPFIIHYANLVKGLVDAFVIGSELVALTKLRTKDGLYTFVDCLVALALETKEILGQEVLVTYGADWSEYHTSDGINRPLDKLWASEGIDIVGIDAYFPLTDTDKQRITRQEIREGWQSGEGWDYYYEGGIKKPYNKGELWNCWKNLEYWWSSEHLVGEERTEWVPCMKKLWFIETGFPSVDRATNKPNVFFDHASSESAFPKGSQGGVDFAIQKEAILATIDFCKSQGYIDNWFFWCWDARGKDWGYDKYYSDYLNWDKGHWINAKIGYDEPLYILPMRQNNLYINSFTDVDIIPSLIISGRLEIITEKAIKIRDDLVVPNASYLPYSIKYSYGAISHYIKALRDKYLSNYGGKSEVNASKAYLLFSDYIVKTLVDGAKDELQGYEQNSGPYIDDYNFFVNFSAGVYSLAGVANESSH